MRIKLLGFLFFFVCIYTYVSIEKFSSMLEIRRGIFAESVCVSVRLVMYVVRMTHHLAIVPIEIYLFFEALFC